MQSYFLVCVRFSLVATDIVATLEDMGLGTPLVASDETDALRLLIPLAPQTALHFAVIEATPEAFATSALRAPLEACGTRVVLISDIPVTEREPPSYSVLAKPFFTEDLVRLVAGFRPA